MGYENTIVEKENNMAIVTLNRPEKLNVMDFETVKKLTEVFKDLEKDNSVRSVIITGSGDKAFCAGVDLNDLNKLKGEKEINKFVDMVHGLCFSIENLNKPVIAAVNGYCLGGGCELAMSCDIRIASPDARFSQPEVKVGIIPGAGGTQRLPLLIGVARAKEMIFSGEMIGADDAFRVGLVNRVIDKENLLDEAKNLANKINENSHNAVRLAKSVLNKSFKAPGYNLEKEAFAECFNHPDQKEGIGAFLNKKKPKFK